MSKKDEHINYVLAAKYLAGECSESEIAEFEQWIKTSTENGRAFKTYERIWRSGSLDEFDQAGDIKTFDADKAWSAVDRQISRGKPTKLISTGSKLWKYIGSVAAMLIIGSGIWFYHINNQKVPQAMIVLSTVDESGTFYLPDGSKLTLNKMSSVAYHEDFTLNNLRTVELKSGEAFFDVVKNESMPFRVLTRMNIIEVIGTMFSVRENPTTNETILKVTEGKVKFGVLNQAPADFLSVTKNQSVTYSGSAGSFSPIEEIITNDLFWVNRLFIFRNSSLKEVFNALGANYKVNIGYDSAALKNCELSARFEDEDIEEIASAIALSMNLEYTLNRDSLVFTGPGCDHD